jgi:hypothetical protein
VLLTNGRRRPSEHLDGLNGRDREVFGDRVIATAILDRILHHAITLNIRGQSYRLKDKLEAGLVKPVEATT